MSNDIGWAVTQLKARKQVTRPGWNGKGMYLYLRTFDHYEPAIVMRTAEGKDQPGWLASQADLLATDWVIADLPED